MRIGTVPQAPQQAATPSAKPFAKYNVVTPFVSAPWPFLSTVDRDNTKIRALQEVVKFTFFSFHFCFYFAFFVCLVLAGTSVTVILTSSPESVKIQIRRFHQFSLVLLCRAILAPFRLAQGVSESQLLTPAALSLVFRLIARIEGFCESPFVSRDSSRTPSQKWPVRTIKLWI